MALARGLGGLLLHGAGLLFSSLIPKNFIFFDFTWLLGTQKDDVSLYEWKVTSRHGGFVHVCVVLLVVIIITGIS